MRSRGDVYKRQVVHSLLLRDRVKGLSTGEKRMLETAKQILISELVMVQGLSLIHI